MALFLTGGLVLGLGLSPWFWFGLPAAYVLCAVTYLLILLVTTIFIPNRNQGTNSPFCRFILYHSLRWFLVLFHTEVVFEGKEKLPEEPFVLVSNHNSALDPIVTFCTLPRRKIAFVAKMSILKIPVAGNYIAACGFLGIERNKPLQSARVINQAADMVKESGFDFGIYPEGTRSKDGTLLPFKKGAFLLAKKAEAPMAVALLEGTRKMRFLSLRKTTVRVKLLAVIDKKEVEGADTEALSEKTRRILLKTGNFK